MATLNENCSMPTWAGWPIEMCMIKAYFGVTYGVTKMCDFLKTFDSITENFYYVMALIPYILACIAIISNLILIFIALLVLKSNENSSRNMFTFLLSRSISIILIQIIPNICFFGCESRLDLFIWILLSFLCVLISIEVYFIMSFSIYYSLAHPTWYKEKATLKNSLLANALIWILSIAFTTGFGVFSSFIFFSEKNACDFECERPFAIFLISMFIFLYFIAFKITAIYIFLLIKLRRVTSFVKIQNNLNKAVSKRLLYNVVLFFLTRSPFLIFCILLLNAAVNFKLDLECNEIYYSAINFEVYLNAITIMAQIGMITDPVFTIWFEFKMIKSLFKK